MSNANIENNHSCDYECEYRKGEYCILLDDVLSYEKCIFRKENKK